MKKFLVLAALLAGVAVTGTSLAVYRGSGEAAKAPAPVTDVQTQSAATAGRSGCGGSCCGGSGGGAAAASKAAQIQAYLVDYYTKSLGPEVTVEVRDLGCHHEADIMKDGQLVKRLSINGGTVTDITEA